MVLDALDVSLWSRRLDLPLVAVAMALSERCAMTPDLVAALALDIDFAIDVTEPRDARLRRFERIIAGALASSSRQGSEPDEVIPCDYAAVGRALVHRGAWHRSDGATYLALRVDDGSDLSCLAMRKDAAEKAVRQGSERPQVTALSAKLRSDSELARKEADRYGNEGNQVQRNRSIGLTVGLSEAADELDAALKAPGEATGTPSGGDR